MVSLEKKLQLYLEKIYYALYQRKFLEGEKIVIKLIEEVITQKKTDREIKIYLNFFNSIHQDFNSSYLKWVKKQKGDIKKEISQLSSINHDNFLFGHSRCPASFDDLFYELKILLQKNLSKKVKSYLKYNLSCYNNLKK